MFLNLWVEWVKNLPPKPETTLTLIIAAARWALSLTLFSSILITLNYIIRRNFFPLASIICVIVLSLGFCYGIFAALNYWKPALPAQTAGVKLGDKGLILSNSLNRNVTSVILLEGTLNPLGPHVTAIPGQPLIFYDSVNTNSALGNIDRTFPPVPFSDDTPWFLKSLGIDIKLNADIFQQKFNEGILQYLIYIGSFIFILSALGYLFKFSVWPLANLFLATLAFRGILALGTFFNSSETQELITSFLNNRIPVTLALPLSFFGFGALVYIYLLLSFAARRKVTDDD